MDNRPFQPTESSSSAATFANNSSIAPAAAAASSAQPDKAPLRASSRIRAAKEKEREAIVADSLPRRTREHASKGKGKELTAELSSSSSSATRSNRRNSRRATLPPPTTATPLIIQDSQPALAKDPKGKKRAAPEPSPPSSDNDHNEPSASTSVITSGPSPAKRSRKMKKTTTAAQPSKRPTRSTSTKGKARTKTANPGPSRTDRADADADMMDVDESISDNDDAMKDGDARGPGNDEDAIRLESEHESDEGVHDHDHDDGDGDEDEEEERNHEAGGNSGAGGGTGIGALSGHSIEETFAMFDFGRLGGYMSQVSSRLRTLLNDIKPSADPTTRLIALQELSELLSISTEDSLAGSFQVESFVRELVRILGGNGGDAARDGEDDDDEGDADDDESALAAALALSAGGAPAGDENLEAQLLACRCLANLMEALPGVGHTLVYHGAIPVLCSKLLEISFIDLAEQTLLTLEKISEEYPSAIVREGGLAALLNFLDFFSMHVQRTALQAAANCCRNISPDSFQMVKDVWPILRGCLGYADQKLVDYAALCVIRVIESYHRAHADKLEALVDAELIRAVNALLLPAGGSPIIPVGTYTQLIKGLATAARASPTIAISLLQADIVVTLFQILTGVLPPSEHEAQEEQGSSTSGQGVGGGLADMTVMQNLAHKPKEQIEEALNLVSELMPPLPKDGIFDHKGYSERALSRMIKAKAKADRHMARQAVANQLALQADDSAPSSRAETPTNAPIIAQEEEQSQAALASASENSDHQPSAVTGLGGGPDASVSTASISSEAITDRTALLRQHEAVMDRFITLMVPILVDVYAASVSVPVRIKSLASMLKAISFQDEEQLKRTLKNVPLASFTSSILSAKDHLSLMIGGLQMVELLLSKASAEFKSSFRREGVLYEIELLASRPLPPRSKDKKVKEEAKEDALPAPLSMEVITGPASASDIQVIAPPTASASKSRSQPLDPEDAYTLRSRVIRFKYLMQDGPGDKGDATFTKLRTLVEELKTGLKDKGLEEARRSIEDLAELFESAQTSVSSFELLQSGIVDALLEFATSKQYSLPLSEREELLMNVLANVRDTQAQTTPLAVFVKKLQESLTRMETFEVSTVSSNPEADSKRNTPSLLARSIRLRLIAEESPEASSKSPTGPGTSNIVVSIHAIATFQALNDYLRPRLTGLLSSLPGASKLPGMLSALASGRIPPELLGATFPGLTSAFASSSPSLPPIGTSASAPPRPISQPERRRSQRLSAKASSASLSEAAATTTTSSRATASGSGAPSEAAAPPSVASTSTVVTAPPQMGSKGKERNGRTALEELMSSDDGASDDDIVDASVDADVFESSMDGEENAVDEKTVNVSVADDGSRVVAQTPDGTRVATPAAEASSSASTAAHKASYAAALKSKPTDWHLEFYMDDKPLPLDMTIYGAIHQHEARKTPGGTVPSSMFWTTVYTVKYKKAPGPALLPDNTPDSLARARSPVTTLSSLPDEAPHSKIVKLLRILHKLNIKISESQIGLQAVPDSGFVNNKLTAKLTRQLEEPMIVASACLPEWAMDLPLHFPFLFPFSTRFSFLQSTSFGYARLILKWQSQNRGQESSSRRDDNLGFLGRLQRQKVRISRKHLIESAFKVFELYGSSSSILEVEYFDEAGTGLGPTLEFYSLVSREFCRRDLKIWRDADSMQPGPYAHHPTGLFPVPVSLATVAAGGDVADKKTYVFKIIGQFVAKAMLDSRIIDMNFNKIFLKLVLGEEVPQTIANLALVDPALASSLRRLQLFADAHKQGHMAKDQGSVEDMMLDFTLPGYDIELRPGGKDTDVTIENVKEYIQEVIDATIGTGAAMQAKAFREGFSRVFPVTDLQAFSSDELGVLFGSAEEDWSIETLTEALKADHGFNVESPAIRDLLTIMSDYDATARRSFLQFITGSPKLPIGGFRGLNPPLTVVRKPHEAPFTADDYLPSVMTCVNYLKLPQYSSREVMREKLSVAMSEGVGSFHLS